MLETARALTISLGDMLTNPRTLTGSGKIVDETIKMWLAECADIQPYTLGRSVQSSVSQLSDSEAGIRVKATIDALDPDQVGKFFQLCAANRLRRIKD